MVSRMDEYVMLTLLADPGEAQPAFAARLSAFWTHMLRQRPDDFERVYAEAAAFEEVGGRSARRYLAEAAVADVLEVELSTAGLAFEPIDRDDLYSKYEAAPPDWMQIEH
jgi:hypothetical protein